MEYTNYIDLGKSIWSDNCCIFRHYLKRGYFLHQQFFIFYTKNFSFFIPKFFHFLYQKFFIFYTKNVLFFIPKIFHFFHQRFYFFYTNFFYAKNFDFFTPIFFYTNFFSIFTWSGRLPAKVDFLVKYIQSTRVRLVKDGRGERRL